MDLPRIQRIRSSEELSLIAKVDTALYRVYQVIYRNVYKDDT